MEIKDFLLKNKLNFYDFSQYPKLILLKNDEIMKKLSIIDASKTKLWSKSQKSFIKWTQNKEVFDENFVKTGYSMYDSYFNKQGFLKGNILDVGGGWGLLREWWCKSPNTFYFVHDPGVERFLRGPHPTHGKIFSRALNQPMIFVEGFGEELPYKENAFDTCIIASALDHVLFPDKVIKECYRCLNDESSILIVQSVENGGTENSSLFANYRSKIQNYIFGRGVDHHVNKFTLHELTDLLKKAGFMGISFVNISESDELYAIKAKKITNKLN